VEDLINLKNQYRGTSLYASTKRVTNSFVEDTKILTPDGAVPITKIEVGDTVYAFDTENYWHYETTVDEVFEYPEYRRGVYRFHNSSIDLEVTPDHEMVYVGVDGETHSTTAKALAETLQSEVVTVPSVRGMETIRGSVLSSEDVDYYDTSHGVYCLQVEGDDHTVLAGRNGTFSPVHQSVYGITGYATEDSSFRLFDWRLAEAITLMGRKMIQFSRDYVLDYLHDNGYPDAYASHGDSVPGDEVVLVRDLDEQVDVRRIEDLYEEHEGWDQMVGYEVWTDQGFTPVKDVIQKPNRKQMYRVRTKEGVVHVTEDHSLILDDGTEVSPTEIEKGDELLQWDIGYSLPHVPDPDSDWLNEDLAWLLGLFVADGSCGVYESNGEKKRPWAINKDDTELLERAGQVVEDHFNVNADVRDYRESSGCYKLKANGFDNGRRIEFVNRFRDICYDGDEKQVPPSVLNASDEIRHAFLSGYHDGDGYVNDRTPIDEFDEMQFRDRILAQGIATLLENEGYEITIDTRDNHGEEYYRIRTVSFHQGSPTEVESIEEVEYGDDYVYDLETRNGHFQAGIGDIIVHNTDGCGISVEGASTRDRAMEIVGEAVEKLNEEGYDEFFEEQFGVDPSQHRGEIEIESYSPTVFIPSTDPPHGEDGVKKRRVEWITWNDDDGEDVDEIDITGLEAERSDIAPITRVAQEEFGETLRMDEGEGREYLFPKLREWAETIKDGEMDLERVAKRQGIGQNLHEYGTQSRRPSPIYRGAKYANENIGDVTIQHGDKPICVYVKDVRGDYPSVYDAVTAEDGDRVDAVALPTASMLPEEFVVDWEKHLDKSLISPMEPLLETRGWPWSDILYDHRQSGLEAFEQ
jgi:hypothetical protein